MKGGRQETSCLDRHNKETWYEVSTGVGAMQVPASGTTALSCRPCAVSYTLNNRGILPANQLSPEVLHMAAPSPCPASPPPVLPCPQPPVLPCPLAHPYHPSRALCMIEEREQQQQLAGMLLVRELLPPLLEQLNGSI